MTFTVYFSSQRIKPNKIQNGTFYIYFLGSYLLMRAFLGPLSDRRGFLQGKLNYSEEVP